MAKPNELEGVWRYINKGEPNECWEWTLSTWNSGYGRYTVQGRSLSAHRLVYELEHGEIDKNTRIWQKCKNKLCCNPAHLRAVGNHKRNSWIF